jgi:hypothetical protein
MYAVEMASCGMIYFTSLMKIGRGVHGTFTFFIGNLKDCNVGITDVRELRITLPIWIQVP